MEVYDEVSKHEMCSTGIEELDVMLSGGIPMGSTVLVVGSSGSGKGYWDMLYGYIDSGE